MFCLDGKILQKTNRRTMDFIRHMRRSAISAGRPGGLIREITWKGNMRVGLSDEKRKTLGVIWFLKNKKSAIHVARLTIHEVDVRNRPYFSDKLVEDWRWQKR